MPIGTNEPEKYIPAVYQMTTPYPIGATVYWVPPIHDVVQMDAPYVIRATVASYQLTAFPTSDKSGDRWEAVAVAVFTDDGRSLTATIKISELADTQAQAISLWQSRQEALIKDLAGQMTKEAQCA